MPMRKFDAIVVGAGPAGITAAYELAKRGIEPLLIERGEHVGVKNMFGGVVAGEGFRGLVDDPGAEGVIERPITRKRFSLLNADLCVSMECENTDAKKPFGFTTYRPRFDRWYAGLARKAGARLVTELSVEDLLVDDGRVVGVRTDREEGELYSDIVVLADGVNSIIHRNGTNGEGTDCGGYSLGVKEIVKVDRDVFRRLGIDGEREGLSHEFVGLDGCLVGGGFLYTNNDSLSVGVVADLRSLIDSGCHIHELLDRFKNSPPIRLLVSGGRSLEFSAHLIPPPYRRTTTLFSHGLIVAGDAAGFVLSTGLHFEGVNYAVASGVAAASAVADCVRRRDYSRRTTSGYLRYLRQGNVLQDLKRYRKATALVKSPGFHRRVPGIVCSSVDGVLRTPDRRPRTKLMHHALAKADRDGRMTRLQDFYKMLRAYVC
jgi:electron transfer flavoprotein-quinone oxidoreductase